MNFKIVWFALRNLLGLKYLKIFEIKKKRKIQNCKLITVYEPHMMANNGK